VPKVPPGSKRIHKRHEGGKQAPTVSTKVQESRLQIQYMVMLHRHTVHSIRRAETQAEKEGERACSIAAKKQRIRKRELPVRRHRRRVPC
jgi:hypothetical protein